MSATLAQLIASYNELATAAGKPTRKGFDNKAAAEAAIKAIKKDARKAGGQVKVRAAAKARVAGPRGFSFGPVWMESIKAGAGIALQAANMPKLLATAEKYGVEITADLTQDEVAKMVAKAI